MTTHLPGTTLLLTHATPDFPRHCEGDLIALADGRLLFAWGRKNGTSDFAAGVVLTTTSADGGLTWDAPRVVMQPWAGKTDVMSVSLCRTPRGVHLFFLADGENQMGDLQVYQIISADEGESWSAPQLISARHGYYILNNARVQRTAAGRLLAPVAYVDRHIIEQYTRQRVCCLFSDDDGAIWRESNDLAHPDNALMEPGLIECADGSIYMTIRTSLGYLFEARSHDGGATWGELRRTELLSCEAPATLLRDPASDALWIFWNNNETAAHHNAAQPPEWMNENADVAVRNPFSVAVSHDSGRTWGDPRLVDDTPGHSFGYMSATLVGDQVYLTYNDWLAERETFYLMDVRLRIVPLAWLRG